MKKLILREINLGVNIIIIKVILNIKLPLMNRKVGYVYEPSLVDIHYGIDHPMKPMKVVLTNDLIEGYYLDEKMSCYVI